MGPCQVYGRRASQKKNARVGKISPHEGQGTAEGKHAHEMREHSCAVILTLIMLFRFTLMNNHTKSSHYTCIFARKGRLISAHLHVQVQHPAQSVFYYSTQDNRIGR